MNGELGETEERVKERRMRARTYTPPPKQVLEEKIKEATDDHHAQG